MKINISFGLAGHGEMIFIGLEFPENVINVDCGCRMYSSVKLVNGDRLKRRLAKHFNIVFWLEGNAK